MVFIEEWTSLDEGYWSNGNRGVNIIYSLQFFQQYGKKANGVCGYPDNSLISSKLLQMHNHMCLQCTLPVEPFTTHLTAERFLSCVNSHMIDKCRWKLEVLATNRTKPSRRRRWYWILRLIVANWKIKTNNVN